MNIYEEISIHQLTIYDSVIQGLSDIINHLIFFCDKFYNHKFDIIDLKHYLKKLCAEAYCMNSKKECANHSRNSNCFKLLLALEWSLFRSLAEFERMLKSVDNEINNNIILLCCWLLNSDHERYILFCPSKTIICTKRNLLQDFLENSFETVSRKCTDAVSFIHKCFVNFGLNKLHGKMDEFCCYNQRCLESHFRKKLIDVSLSISNEDSNQGNVDMDGSIYDRPRDPPGQRSVYIPPGDTCRESYRLSTFIRFPEESPVSPRLLAASGFFYTGYKDRVKCFCCGLCVESWVINDDVTSSRWHRENCQMMLQEECGNVPIGQLFGSFTRPRIGGRGILTTEGRTASGNMSSQNFSNAERSTQNNTLSMSMELSSNQSRSGERMTVRQTARPVQPPRQIQDNHGAIELASIPSVQHEHFIRSLNLRREADRLKSFDSWPPSYQTVHPSELARCGFFYLGNLDRVQCFSCSGVLRNWSYGDSVAREHRTHFPNCRMVRGIDLLNVPLQDSERPQAARPMLLQEPPDPTEAEQRDLQVMFPCLNPISPHMRNEENRFDTFDDRWPAIQIRASPRQISHAGFFFLGDRDRVKCFYCNGGLQNWDPDDEPWTEHAKWFPTCEFLLQRKGPEFVHRIVALFPNLPRPVLQRPFDVAPGGGPARAPSPPPRIIDPRVEMQRIREQVNSAMTSQLAVEALSMGFEESIVRKVIKRKVERSGEMYTTMASMVEDLTEISEISSVDSENNQMQTEVSQSTKVKSSEESVLLSRTASGEIKAPTEGASGGTSGASNTSNNAELSLPEEVSPSMEARIRELQEERKCKICLDKIANIVFVPCGHLCCCDDCANALRKCPICRNKIEKAYRTYLS